jgi:hypothetical protein
MRRIVLHEGLSSLFLIYYMLHGVRYYICTPRGLDTLREVFTLRVSAISSYELGQGEVGEVMEAISGEGEEQEGELQKIKHVLLGLSARLQALEDIVRHQQAQHSEEAAELF